MSTNYYADFRKAAYNSSNDRKGGDLGRFDPMNAVVVLRKDIAEGLDATSGLPSSSVEEGGSEVIRQFATYLHETIHWWQHVGSISGMHYAMCIPAQSLTTIEYLSDLGNNAKKPLVENDFLGLPSDHPSFLASSRWSEAEFGASLLFTPTVATSVLQSNPKFFTSIGDSIARLMISNVWTVAQTLDPNFKSLQDPREWFEIFDDLVARNASSFTPKQLIEIPVGMEEVLEGQARLSEIQYLHRAYQPRDWDEVKSSGDLDGVYGSALNYFFANLGWNEPNHATDPIINLFLVLCDISINHGEGYPFELGSDDDLIYRIHPGVRFMKLVNAVNGDDFLLSELRSPDFDAYKKVTERICQKLNWPPPLKIAEDTLKTIRLMENYPLISDARDTGRFGYIDVPILFYFLSQESLLESKLTHPEFFCWPGLTLTVEEENQHTDKLRELLSNHMPPFQSSSLDAEIDTINVPISKELRKSLPVITSQPKCFMIYRDNGFRGKGEFKLDFFWKGEMSSQEMETLHNQFASTFGVELIRFLLIRK